MSKLDECIQKGLALRPDLKSLKDFVKYIQEGHYKKVIKTYCDQKQLRK